MHNLKSAGIEDLPATQALTLHTQAAFEYQYSFALWKLPYDDTKHFIMDFSKEEKTIKPDIANLPAGFLVSPFLNEENAQTTFIKADLYYQFKKDGTAQHLSSSPTCSDAIEKLNNAIAQLKDKPNRTYNYSGVSKSIAPTKKEDFITFTSKAIEEIRQGKLEKLVPSRVKLIDIPDQFDLIDCFHKLCNAYPHAMVSIIATPTLGTWIGATPEVLVSMDKNEIFRTMSLAGTQKLPAHNTSSAESTITQASWMEKEIEEQALVSRYIINCFKKIRLREYTEKGPKTILAGNLMHLKTDFSVDTKTVAFPELPTVMLELLHPTSAVCGMPREASIDFIKENEGFDRELFSGYLGPVNIQEESNIFVNLRCMQLLDKKAAVYAGAGVTINSDPEKEWSETALKCETLLNVLLKNN